MATVYLAYDPRFKREVAIKVLPRQFTHDTKFLQRFEQEAQTIASLEDPAIVPVYDFGEHDDAPYLVMRYLAGGTLRRCIAGDPLPLAEIDRILQRLAPALDYAHRQGVIHRDLKPDNVLFDQTERPYLTDFGIARMAEATHTMTMIGTPAYMSPEQAQGKLKLDSRSDIYGMGVMLYEMLSGCQPYVAETPSSQMIMHILEPVPDVLAANPALPPQAQAVVEKGMAKDREQRYRTAVELAQAVQQLLAASEQSAEPPEADALLVDLSQAPEPQTAEPDRETVIDTPPEDLAPKPTQSSSAQPKKAPLTPLPVVEKEQEAKKGSSLPSWVWWAGAIAVLLLLGAGIFAIFNNGAGSELLDAVKVGDATPEAPAMPANPKLGTSWLRPQDKKRMLYVPRGTFAMGSEHGASDALPIHDVTLDAYWIDMLEVTNAQYALCVDSRECAESGSANDAALDGADHPIVGLSWYDAAAYCRWTGTLLPSEAQWEYAARGTAGNIYPWGDKAPTCDLAKYGDCGGRTVPVGSYAAGDSWIRAMDLAGNAWEWVNDWYDQEYYSNSPAANPIGPQSGLSKVIRGGGWGNGPSTLLGANRNHIDPVRKNNHVGFRCALPAR